jgi:hypothetical protein
MACELVTNYFPSDLHLLRFQLFQVSLLQVEIKIKLSNDASRHRWNVL